MEKIVFNKIKNIVTNEGAFANKKIKPYANYTLDEIKKYTTFNDVIDVIKKGYDIDWAINTYFKQTI